MSKTVVLTGITTTGTPHIGNYVGAIRPAIEASRKSEALSFYFLADYHALVKCHDPAGHLAGMRTGYRSMPVLSPIRYHGNSRAYVDYYLYDRQGIDEPGPCLQSRCARK